MKKALKVIGIVLLALVLLLALGVAWLTIKEYKPAPVEQAAVEADGTSTRLTQGQELAVLSWNIGYAGLGADADFFMDGGEQTGPGDKETVTGNLAAIAEYLDSCGADIKLLQEVDTNSGRTYSIDETQALRRGDSAYALNYSCPFVPYPLPPIGKVNSGVLTVSGCEIEEAERVALPCPFSWPIRAANLKRCLLVSYLPIEGSEKQLVLINLHLEAYDSGEGKRAQTEQLRNFMQAEYDKGNYVIAGGDFNQSFPGGTERFENTHGDIWTPGLLEDDSLPQGWRFAYDLDTPSCRLLNQPYDRSDTENTQYYVIDGFILSPNVELESVGGVDLGFENSDHNPVLLKVKLG